MPVLFFRGSGKLVLMEVLMRPLLYSDGWGRA